jgi:hypothetical protein
MPHPGISLGGKLWAIAQAPFFREPFSGAFFRNFVPEKPSGHPFSAHFVRRKSMHGKRKT